ncbi:hypothetical protein ACN47E_008725 [Coniothyrium glycines]
MPSPYRRVVTGHKDGKSTVMIDDKLDLIEGFAAHAATVWTTHQYPSELATHDAAQGHSEIYTKGSLIRVVDFPALSQGHNHRSKSLDYGIVLDGEIELLLEDGSKTIVRAGEVIVQQGTMHQWNNNTEKPCRIVFVLLPAQPAQGPDGKALGDSGIPKEFSADDN